MQHNNYYQEFAHQFASQTTQELINRFNRQVGNRGWTAMRSCHDLALADELRRSGLLTILIKPHFFALRNYKKNIS